MGAGSGVGANQINHLLHVVNGENMTSVREWAEKAQHMKEKGLSDREIAEELHLSPETIAWLLTRRETSEHPPADVKIGWRSIGVFGSRIQLTAALMVDIIQEEICGCEGGVDTVVGLSVNGVPLAAHISAMMECELAIYRPTAQDSTKGSFMSNYASVEGKRAVLVDDVIGTGRTLTGAFRALREEGGEPVLGIAVVNKTPYNVLGDVRIRSLIRARAISGE